MTDEGPGKLDPKTEAEGLKAYEQVCAFERLRSWRLPLGYVVFVSIPIFFGSVMLWQGRETGGIINFLAAIGFALMAGFHWGRLKARYAKNLQRVNELEAVYGEQLAWVKVEKHFAQLEQLKRELEEERAKDNPE